MGFSRYDYIDRGGVLVDRLELLTGEIEAWLKSGEHIVSRGDDDLYMDATMSDSFSDIYEVIQRLENLGALLV